jgi:hypothetical protein
MEMYYIVVGATAKVPVDIIVFHLYIYSISVEAM